MTDMPTNGYCTILRSDDNDEYYITGTYPCMWQEVEGYEVKKYGDENADKVSVYIFDPDADVKKRDCIVRGKLEDISEFVREQALTVMSAPFLDYGSPETHHFEIGAR